MCEFAYYNSDRLLCKITKDNCLYSKYCDRQHKYIHRDGVENCYMAIDEKRKDIPNGAYYVRFVKKGYAYIELGDKIVKVKDTIGVNNYVYVFENNGEYEISLSPFKHEETTPTKKRATRKKT